jgi:hypothetical protein
MTLLRVVLVLGLVVGAVALPPPVVRGAEPTGRTASGTARVAIIVGPVGSLTDYYRGMARAAATEARRHTDNVVTVYSPDATWPRVKAALSGASVVVYLGHGNGWPSPYSDVPRPQTQNGLGLNPVAGEGDSAHQYFGEQYLERSVRLAAGAVVLLHHLCYASGAAEPGMAQPTLAVAVQRVDNFGAGWLAAGASAVIAEAHGEPDWYVRALFQRRGTVESMWRRNPNFHDHVLDFESSRTPGARLMLDPDRASTGFYRSIVLRPGATSTGAFTGATPRSGPGGGDDADAPGPAWTSPVEVDLAGPVVAGSTARLLLVFAVRRRTDLPPGLTIGARWDPILIDGAPPGMAVASEEPLPEPAVDPVVAASAAPHEVPPTAEPTPTPSAASAAPLEASPSAEPLPTPSAEPSPTPSAEPSPTPSAEPSPTPSAATSADLVGTAPNRATQSATPSSREQPPEVDLVAPETAGTLVVTAPAEGKAGRRSVLLIAPETPGLYRLVTTLHDKDGVAFDAASQDQVPALLVKVTGVLSASYGLPSDISAAAGDHLVLPVRVVNSGSMPWSASPADGTNAAGASTATGSARLVGHWIRLEGVGLAGELPLDAAVLVDVEPGRSAVVDLPLETPSAAGSYLLVLDVVLPDGRSLAVSGVPPALVRVTVEAGPAPATNGGWRVEPPS